MIWLAPNIHVAMGQMKHWVVVQCDVSGGGGPAVAGGEGDGGVSEKKKIRGKGHNPVHEMYDIVTRLR